MFTPLRHPLASFLAGLRFLTIVPFSWHGEKDGEFFQPSLFYFPVIGLLIGAVVATTTLALSTLVPDLLLTVMAVLLLAAISGCLHLDGLADCADGFFSHRPKERALEIMRDSRCGAMGVIVLCALFLLKIASLGSLSASHLIITLFLMPVVGRSAIVCTMALVPYARETKGLGLLFYSKQSRYAALWAGVFCALTLFIVVGLVNMLFILGSVLLLILLFARLSKKRIGGATGDSLGAICELSELMVAMVMASLFGF